jgi:hypothetical protein
LKKYQRRLILAAAILLPLAAVATPTIGRFYRDWQDQRMLQEAREAMIRNQPADARVRAQHLIRRGKFTQDAYPILLKSSEALGDPRRGDHARAFLRKMPPDSADRPLAWRIVCRDCSTWLVLFTWASLPADEQARPDFVVPLLDRLHINQLHDHARELIATLPEPWPVEIELRRLRIDLADRQGISSIPIQHDIARILAHSPGFASPLLELLDELPQQELLHDTSAKWLRALGDPPGDLSTIDRLRRARLQMAADPERADSIFNEIIRHHRVTDLLATIRFCIQTGRYAEAGELLRETDPATEPEAHRLARQVAELTDELERWQELVSAPIPSDDLPELHADAVFVARKIDAATSAPVEAAAIRATSALVADDALIRLARRAEFRGMDDFAQRAWLAAIRHQRGPLPLSSHIEPLIRDLAAAGRENEIADLLASYRNAEPGNLVILIQHSYLSCLLGRIPPSSLIRDLTPLLEKSAETPALRFAIALGHLLEDRPMETLSLIDPVAPQVIAASPAYQAIRATAMDTAGQPDTAAPLLAKVDWNALLPSEKRLLQQVIQRHTAADSK